MKTSKLRLWLLLPVFLALLAAPRAQAQNFAAAGRIRFPDGAIARDFCDSGDYSRQHIKEKGFPSKNLHGTL